MDKQLNTEHLLVDAYTSVEGGLWNVVTGPDKHYVVYPLQLSAEVLTSQLGVPKIAAIRCTNGRIYDFILGRWRELVVGFEQVSSPGRLMQAHGANRQATKADTGKLRYSLLPSFATEEVVRVLEFGAKKYAAHNWQKGMEWTRMYDAARRHLEAWQRGEDTDPESGIPHIAHAICCLMFLLEYQRFGVGTDDRNQLAGNPFVKA